MFDSLINDCLMQVKREDLIGQIKVYPLKHYLYKNFGTNIDFYHKNMTIAYVPAIIKNNFHCLTKKILLTKYFFECEDMNLQEDMIKHELCHILGGDIPTDINPHHHLPYHKHCDILSVKNRYALIEADLCKFTPLNQIFGHKDIKHYPSNHYNERRFVIRKN